MRKKHRSIIAILLFCLALSTAGCGSEEPSSSGAEDAQAVMEEHTEPEAPQAVPDSQTEDAGQHYEIPEFLDVTFDQAAAQSGAGAYIDTSHASEGYVGVSAVETSRLKFQILYGETTYTYNLPGDGTVTYFPLSCGDGEYYVRIMVNVVDNRYSELFATTVNVVLEDEFQPFLRPSQYVNYTRESDCVELAGELAGESEDSLDFIAKVYEYICGHVTYDYDLASSVASGYLPDPDRTLESEKGICFDYAALAAAMLRSQGIPTKLITGYVAPDDLFHAWNMIGTEKAGWIVVGFEVNEEDWTRLDLTFAANGSNADFIGDGSNYADLYQY